MITISEIQKTVGEYFGIPRSKLLGPRRNQAIAVPRQISMILCRELTSVSLPKIGDMHGGRDHTTVLHACRRKLKPKMAEDLAIIRAKLQELKAVEVQGPPMRPQFFIVIPPQPKPMPKRREGSPEPRRSPPTPMRAVLLPSDIRQPEGLLRGSGREWARRAKFSGGTARRHNIGIQNQTV